MQGLYIGLCLHHGGIGKATREVDLVQFGAAGRRSRCADKAAEHAQVLVQTVGCVANSYGLNVGFKSHFLDTVTPARAVDTGGGDFCTGINPGARVILHEREVHRTGQGQVASGRSGADTGVESVKQRVGAAHQIRIYREKVIPYRRQTRGVELWDVGGGVHCHVPSPQFGISAHVGACFEGVIGVIKSHTQRHRRGVFALGFGRCF